MLTNEIGSYTEAAEAILDYFASQNHQLSAIINSIDDSDKEDILQELSDILMEYL